MPDDLQVCVKTTLPIERDMERKMVNYFWQQAAKQHLDMGFGGAPNSYIFDSWLWRRLSFMNRYENDFSDRLALPPQRGGSLYARCNKSLNFPKQFVKSYHASATADLESYGWFSVSPEGGEDEHPALPLFERYLRERAKRMNLGMLLKNESARPALIRGESVCQVLKRHKTRVEPRSVRAVRDMTQPGDKPLRDSRNQLVTELDEWVPDELEPETKVMLKRDPKVWALKNVNRELTKRSFRIEHVLRNDTCADIEFLHPGDFVFDLTRASLDECVRVGSVVGHFHRFAVDDLFDQFAPENITEAGKEYQRQYGKATGNMGGKAAQETPKVKQGESANAADALTDLHAMPQRLYFGGYFRYDWNDDNRREYVYCLIDWENQIPIAYDPTSLVLESDTRTHPYKMMAVAKKSFRAYGEGIYESFNDISESADANYCRIHIEQQTSGKVIAYDPNGFEQTWAGRPLEVRGNTIYKKRDPTKPLKEIIDSVPIPAATEELRQNLNLDMQTMMARGGGVSPTEAEQAGLQGAQTATGLQILERQKDKQDNSICDDLNDAHTDLVQTWAQVEADAFDIEFARKLFRGKQVEIPNPDFDPAMAAPAPVPGPAAPDQTAALPSPNQAPLLVPETVTVDAVDLLAEWIKTVEPDDMRSMIKLVLVKAKESEIASRADNRVKLIMQYSSLAPDMQLACEPEFVQLLMLNGAQDAEKTLKDIQAVTQQRADAMAAQAGLPPPPGSAPGGPPVPANADAEGPVTGRPEPEPFEPAV